jgi:hypothetical protein
MGVLRKGLACLAVTTVVITMVAGSVRTVAAASSYTCEVEGQVSFTPGIGPVPQATNVQGSGSIICVGEIHGLLQVLQTGAWSIKSGCLVGDLVVPCLPDPTTLSSNTAEFTSTVGIACSSLIVTAMSPTMHWGCPLTSGGPWSADLLIVPISSDPTNITGFTVVGTLTGGSVT